MAQSITFHSGSPLIGSPLVYSVVPSAHSDSKTFHRVRLIVYAALETDSQYSSFEFSTPVSNDNAVMFNISSALLAVADSYKYTSIPPDRYPYIKFRLVATDDWIIDGQEYSGQDSVSYPGMLHIESETDGVPWELYREGYCYAILGSMTDMERISIDDPQRVSVTRFSRKPVISPEIVYVGVPVVRPKNFTATIGIDSVTSDYPQELILGEFTEGPKSEIYIARSEGLNTFNPDTENQFSVYAVPAPKQSVQLRFVNGMGCLESVHLSGLVSKEVDIDTGKYTLSRQETINSFSRSIAIKQTGKEKWTLSTPPVDEVWASWFVHEVLIARWAWVSMIKTSNNLSEIWIPVNILPEETTTIIKKGNNSTVTIQIVIELDINGSTLL